MLPKIIHRSNSSANERMAKDVFLMVFFFILIPLLLAMESVSLVVKTARFNNVY